MRIKATWRELLRAETPDWGTCPACEKLRAMLREIYAEPAAVAQGRDSESDPSEPIGF